MQQHAIPLTLKLTVAFPLGKFVPEEVKARYAELTSKGSWAEHFEISVLQSRKNLCLFLRPESVQGGTHDDV